MIQEIKQNIALAFTTEPLKTLRKLEVVDGENKLTPQGKELFNDYLFHKEMQAFTDFIKQYEN